MDKDSKIDWVILLLYFVLLVIGWLNLYATDYNEKNFILFGSNAGKQLVWIVISISIGIIILFFDSHFFSTFAYAIYSLVIFFLVIVLFYGTIVHGSRSWIELGGLRLQPAELAKFATALALAKYFSSFHFVWNWSNLKHILIAFAIVLLPFLLIVLEPDMGSALVFFAFLFVFYREGMSGYWLILFFIVISAAIFSLLINVLWLLLIYIGLALIITWLFYGYKKALSVFLIIAAIFTFLYMWTLVIHYHRIDILIIVSVIIASIYFLFYIFKHNLKYAFHIIFVFYLAIFISYSSDFLYHNILKEHQRERIDLILNKINDPKGVGYNLHQSKIAISSGGLWGKGWLKGTITKYDFVPEENTDFVYCTFAEEWGFIGTLVIFLLYFLLIARIIYIAELQHSVFTRVYGYSVASIIFFHVAINIGMTVGVFPIIGIPLPFFSYGGSAMLGFTILIFILLNLDKKRHVLI